MMIYNGLSEISDKFDLFLFDAYGVFWEGNGFYENSRETMRNLVEQGKTVVVISNTTALHDDITESYAKRGIYLGKDYNFFFSSGDLLKKTLSEGKLQFSTITNPRKYFVIGKPHAKAFADSVYEQVQNLDEADFVYCGVPFLFKKDVKKYSEFKHLFLPVKNGESENVEVWDTLTAEPFVDVVNRVLQKKLPVLNANPDFTAKEGHPLVPDLPAAFVVRNGTIAEMLRKGGAEVLEFGKPHKNIYDFVFDNLKKAGININKSKTCMIGDTVRTDIKGAANAGIVPVLCIKTGVTAEEIKRGNNLENICNKENVAIEQIIQIKSVGGK